MTPLHVFHTCEGWTLYEELKYELFRSKYSIRNSLSVEPIYRCWLLASSPLSLSFSNGTITHLAPSLPPSLILFAQLTPDKSRNNASSVGIKRSNFVQGSSLLTQFVKYRFLTRIINSRSLSVLCGGCCKATGSANERVGKATSTIPSLPPFSFPHKVGSYARWSSIQGGRERERGRKRKREREGGRERERACD